MFFFSTFSLNQFNLASTLQLSPPYLFHKVIFANTSLPLMSTNYIEKVDLFFSSDVSLCPGGLMLSISPNWYVYSIFPPFTLCPVRWSSLYPKKRFIWRWIYIGKVFLLLCNCRYIPCAHDILLCHIQKLSFCSCYPHQQPLLLLLLLQTKLCSFSNTPPPWNYSINMLNFQKNYQKNLKHVIFIKKTCNFKTSSFYS